MPLKSKCIDLDQNTTDVGVVEGCLWYNSTNGKLRYKDAAGTKTVVEDADSRLTDSRAPSGAAGGDLGGTYPNPTVNDGADLTAIHDNVAGEINAITEKVSPANGDWLIIEDSAAANAKKKVQVGNLPGGGGGGTRMISVQTHKHNSHYKSDAASGYTSIATLVWPGSTAVGSPTKITANCWVDGGTTGKVRVYDSTNAAVICEATGISSTSSANIVDLGTISNVTAGAAVWIIEHAGNGAQATNTSSLMVEM